MNNFFKILIAAVLGGVMTLGGAWLLGFQQMAETPTNSMSTTPVHFANYRGLDMSKVDFTLTAEQTLPTVVHIAAVSRTPNNRQGGLEGIPEPFRRFFEDSPFRHQEPQRPGPQRRRGTGSGVIISTDGYIVTNNHVVENAEKLEVTLNDNRTYNANIVGTDPNTDIALIKIDADNLQPLQFANSDNVKVGEWVVAVGNPFNLASTVTAGIVSAKGRSINILQGKYPIESFIQTDAAVNPGNSGGALVNLNGDLVGINSAIASPTGVYAGYAFAVPSNIVMKVVEDLKQYGTVQRAFLGAMIRNVDGHFAKENHLEINDGIYVDSLTANSAAADAGIREGDVIIAVDDVAVTSSPELLEQIGRHRPGDKINVTVMRGKHKKVYAVTLKNRSGNVDLVEKEILSKELAALGASFKALSTSEASEMNVKGGVKITDLRPGILTAQTNISEGFVILTVNGQSVNSVESLEKALSGVSGGVMLEGVYPDSEKRYYYAFGMS